MNFKLWIEASSSLAALDKKSDLVFGKREKNKSLDIGEVFKKLGIKTNKAPKEINHGSHANIYENPIDPSRLIKITSDVADAKNLIKAQRLNSPNIAKIYSSAILDNGSYAMDVQKINGVTSDYTSNSIATLIDGDDFDDAGQASKDILNPTGTRLRLLNQLGMDSKSDLIKLSNLFKTLDRLSKIGIDIFDFTDNLIDDGRNLVLVDLGN